MLNANKGVRDQWHYLKPLCAVLVTAGERLREVRRAVVVVSVFA